MLSQDRTDVRPKLFELSILWIHPVVKSRRLHVVHLVVLHELEVIKLDVLATLFKLSLSLLPVRSQNALRLRVEHPVVRRVKEVVRILGIIYELSVVEVVVIPRMRTTSF